MKVASILVNVNSKMYLDEPTHSQSFALRWMKVTLSFKLRKNDPAKHMCQLNQQAEYTCCICHKDCHSCIGLTQWFSNL